MPSISHDVITLLQQEQQWHQLQLRRITLALEVAKQPTQPVVQPRKIQWRKEILQIFQQQNNLLPGEVITHLLENGITEAAMLHRRSNVYVTLTRLVKHGVLEKTATGRYRKI